MHTTFSGSPYDGSSEELTFSTPCGAATLTHSDRSAETVVLFRL